MNKLITVIVPCFNIEKYIEKCIESIENQTYKNIEIIAIDDKSTDNTLKKLKELEEKYENLTVLENEKNGGLAYTRNYGISKAKGEYIGFIDSDDYIVENYYEELIKKAEEENADIVATNIELVYEDGQTPPQLVKGCNEEVSKFNLVNNGLAASACNKIIKKDLIQKYLFLEGKINEDVASILPCLVCAKKVAYVDNVKYFYLQRITSIQNSEVTTKRLDMLDSIDVCLERIKDCEEYEKYRDVILYQQVALLYMIIIPKQKNFQKRQEILDLFMKKQEKYELYKNPYIEQFINEQPEKERKYYRKLVSCLKSGDSEMANNIIKNRIKFTATLKDKIKNEKIKDIIRMVTRRTVIKRSIDLNDLEKLAKKQSEKKESDIKISVVVPNYNYENFLITRIYSILAQTEKLYEIIILDDCSRDNSRELIDQIVNTISKYIKVRKIYNTENSGIAFKQWKKGFENTEGDYVWIAEADDCCDKKLLESIVEPVRKNRNIYISYADTAFINAWDKLILKTIKPEIDIMKTGHWDNNFVDNGLEEIEKYAFLNNTIANVSSCIIKKDNYEDAFEKAITYKQAGDWIFYLLVMKKGDIAYYDKPLNYYRVHGNNVTTTMKKQKHFDEIVRIHNEIRQIIDIKPWQEEEIQKRYDFLKRVWNLEDKD